MGMGLYFALLRPPLLPEDVRFLGVSLPTLQEQKTFPPVQLTTQFPFREPTIGEGFAIN